MVESTNAYMTGINGDQNLVQEALKGNMDSFKTLVNRYEGKVAGVVKSMLGDTPEALDAGQDVFIRFYQSMEKFRGESALGTYLVRIAINLSLNELGKRKKKHELFRPLESAENVSDDGNSCYEDLQFLKIGMDYLEPEFKAVITLRITEGYSTEETAALLNVPIGTVLSRLYRAQKKLKGVLLKMRSV